MTFRVKQGQPFPQVHQPDAESAFAFVVFGEIAVLYPANNVVVFVFIQVDVDKRVFAVTDSMLERVCYQGDEQKRGNLRIGIDSVRDIYLHLHGI